MLPSAAAASSRALRHLRGLKRRAVTAGIRKRLGCPWFHP
jgi:hypothetical protein